MAYPYRYLSNRVIGKCSSKKKQHILRAMMNTLLLTFAIVPLKIQSEADSDSDGGKSEQPS